MNLKTAIVILNYNGKKHLERFLPSVIACSEAPHRQIIIADNGSTDDSVSFLQQRYPDLRLVLLDKNYGFAGGYNQTLKQIDADCLMLLNSDVEVTDNWLDPLEEELDKHADVAACQPKIMSLHRPSYFEHAGACGGYLDKLGYPFCRGRLFETLEEDLGQYDNVCDVFWATGAALLIRSADFFAAGGFDDLFFAHMEEIDLCWRLKSRGRRIVCVPQSVVYHLGGGSMNVKNPYKTYLNFRNNQCMLYKNLSQREFDKIKRFRLLLDYLAALEMLLTGQFSHALQVPKARRDFKKMKPSLLLKREHNLQQALTTSLSGVLSKSLLELYYLRGKRVFSEIEQWIGN